MSMAIYRPCGISMMSTFPTIQDHTKVGGGKCIYELTIIQGKIKKYIIRVQRDAKCCRELFTMWKFKK